MAENQRKPDGRGGRREGSGRHPVALSATQLQEMRAAAATAAKKEGKTLFEVLLGWIYDSELAIKDRQTAMKLYLDKMLISVSEGGDADKALGPAMYLPEQRPVLQSVPKAGDEQKVA